MFKNLAFLVCFLAFAGLNAQVTPTKISHPNEQTETINEDGPVMQFEAMSVDYGEIEQHSDPLRVLKFTNVGKEPLVIKNARGSCGCTVPTWPKEPIMPGESSTIEVRYATNRLGKINKNIKITTNEGANPHVIKVLGNVSPKEEEESLPSSSPSMLGGGGGN